MDPELQEIKLLRKRLSLTQQQLAQTTGVSQSLIAKIEAQLVDPSFTTGKKILNALRALERQEEKNAKELMQRHVITCKAEERVQEIIGTMRKRAISQLPVVQGENVVGMMSESSIIRHMEELKPETKVRDIMEEAPPIILLETPRRVIGELLSHYPLLIVKEKGKIVGILTKADLLRTV